MSLGWDIEVIKGGIRKSNFGAECGEVIHGAKEGAFAGVCGGRWPCWDRGGSGVMLFLFVF